MNPTEQSLEARIRRVERKQRRLTATLALSLMAALLAWARAPQVPDSLQARRIEVVDDEGRVRIELRHDDEETGLFVLDSEGVTRLGAAQFAHGGGGYALHGPGMKGAAVLYLKGEGTLTMYDGEGNVTSRFPPPR